MLTPIPRWVIVIGIPLMVMIAVAAVWLLLGIGVDGAKLDAIRTGGTLGVGLGGVVVLWLAVRRQRSTELDLLQKYEAHQLAERVAAHNEKVAERTATHSERDATARRITDQYGKAVDQLGSDKAPVRLGGLYALERLAQDNPDNRLRQTIVNVICAYLRMPYTLPDTQVPEDADAEARAAHEQRIQERQVRLTAQHILAAHLHPGGSTDQPMETFWEGINLDLTGASLIDLDLSGCQIGAAQFVGAQFVGNTRFVEAKFAQKASFNGAMFAGKTFFDCTEFAEAAWFECAEFAAGTNFADTLFTGHARFTGAKFVNVAFDAAKFARSTKFIEAVFDGNTWFTGTKFARDVSFVGTKFRWDPAFDRAEFECGVPREVSRFMQSP